MLCAWYGMSHVVGHDDGEGTVVTPPCITCILCNAIGMARYPCATTMLCAWLGMSHVVGHDDGEGAHTR